MTEDSTDTEKTILPTGSPFKTNKGTYDYLGLFQTRLLIWQITEQPGMKLALPAKLLGAAAVPTMRLCNRLKTLKAFFDIDKALNIVFF